MAKAVLRIVLGATECFTVTDILLQIQPYVFAETLKVL